MLAFTSDMGSIPELELMVNSNFGIGIDYLKKKELIKFELKLKDLFMTVILTSVPFMKTAGGEVVGVSLIEAVRS